MILLRKRVPIFYNALLLTGVNLLLRLISTSFQVYLSGRIGAEGIGLLQLVMSVGSMSMTAGMAGIRTATMYLTAEALGRKRRGSVSWVLSTCITYSLICSCTIAAGLYFAAPWIAERWIGSIEIIGSIRLFASFLPIVCLCGVMSGYFTAANRIRSLAAVEIAEQFCTMGVTVLALTLWVGSDPVKACQAVVLGSSAGACLTLVCLIVLRLKERDNRCEKIPVLRKLLDTAVPLALADDLKAGISTTENMMVPKRLGMYALSEAPLAEFGTVCGMVFPVMMFPASILFGLNELLIPELARCNAAGSHNRIQYLVQRSLRVAMLYGIFFCGLLVLLADELCMALYSSADAGQYLKQFALMVPMLYCDAVTDAMTKGLGQQKTCVRYNILTSALDVIFLYLLLPKFGMQGYFLSFLVTHLLNFILSLRRLLKITGKHIQWRIPTAAAAVMVAAIWSASHIATPIVRAAAYLALLGSALFLLGIIKKEDLHWLRSLLQHK